MSFYKGWYYDAKITFLGEHGWLNQPKNLGVKAWIADWIKTREFKEFKNITEFKKYARENPPNKVRAERSVS